MTCEDASGAAVPLASCEQEGNTALSWVLDADARGVSIAVAESGDHFDADLFQPGFTALPIGGDGIAIRATAGSDRVIVALRRDDSTGQPGIAWIAPSQLESGVPWSRAPLPCQPRDVQVATIVPAGAGDGQPVESLLLAYDCAALTGIAAFPIDSLAETAEPRTGERRYPLPAPPRAFSVRADGAAAWVSLAVDTGDHVARIDLSKDPSDASAVRTAPLMAAVPAAAQPIPGCPAGTIAPGPLTVGAPVATPDGAFAYVPLVRPPSVAVFDDDLDRIDANAAAGGLEGSGRELLQRVGVKDIPMDAPARSIAMADLGQQEDEDDDSVMLQKGVRALVALQDGSIARVVVTPPQVVLEDGTIGIDPKNAVPHRIEVEDLDDDGRDEGSTAQMPVLRVGDQVYERGIVQFKEFPSFGSPEIASDTRREDASIYYGIRFNGDLANELTETWEATYEGILPGASGCGLLETEPGADTAAFFRDPAADFCALGVSEAQGVFPGDVLVLHLDHGDDCDPSGAGVLEYRVASVKAHRLALEPAYVSLPLPAAGCHAEQPLSYEVRASESWTFVGTQSGFLHNRASDGEECVTRADANPRFTGRALTTLPEDGGTEVQACPIRLGDTRIGIDGGGGWEKYRFQNPSFSLNVVPGCRVDSRNRKYWIPPVRDTRLTFTAATGYDEMFLGAGGLPEDMVVVGTTMYTVDSATGLVYMYDVPGNEIADSWY